MKFKSLILIFLLLSCTSYSTKLENRSPFNSKGFAFIFNEEDYKNKIIKGRLDNSKIQVSHSSLRTNTMLRIINLKTNDSIIVKNLKKIDYPDFYKILITKKVADKLNLNFDSPYVEVIEIKKNKSFVVKKAKIFNEEKKISSNAPVESVKIANISKNKDLQKVGKKDEFFLIIGTFYSKDTAQFLKQRISNELSNYDKNKLIIKKKNKKEIMLISGPYNSINFMKNDYVNFKKFGFEELDISINE